MKHFHFSFCFTLFLGVTLFPPTVRSDDPPPDDTSTNDTGGWLRIDACAPMGSGSADDLPPLTFSSDDSAKNANLPMAQLSVQLSSQPSPNACQSIVLEPLDTGLTTNFPPTSNELIAETVRALDGDWQQCYLFVRNQIHFRPYRGIMRGPERTFLDREGNDADQAFLLRAMLRAAGYTNAGDVTVLYLPPPSTNAPTGGFRIPLGGTSSGYDAVSWFGLSTDGIVSNAFAALNRVTGPCALVTYQATGATMAQSSLLIEHFWVRLNIGGTTYDLDPSFKPCRIIPPSSTICTNMGYSRDALLTAAGGTYGDTGDKYSVKNVSASNLATELRRLSTNLSAVWQTAQTNAQTIDFVGGKQIAIQNLPLDATTFHGVTNGVPQDFLALSNTDKNYLRTSVRLVHGNLDKTLWADEFAARHLWLSYSNATGYTYPKAVLHVDDSTIVSESAGSSTATLNVPITVTRPGPPGFVGRDQHTYGSLLRGVTNVFVIPISIGNIKNNGMRLRALRELDRLRVAGYSESDLSLRARVLQIAGQQWMEQTAMTEEFEGVALGTGRYTFYRVGIAGQKSAPFYDIANIVYCETNGYNGLDIGVLFASALEHGVWDQLNGTNRPSVSTVRIMDLANKNGLSIFLAKSNNYTTDVRSRLTNYSTAMLDFFKTNSDAGRWLLIPRDGQIALKSWKGYGYIMNGPDDAHSGIVSFMAIDGGLSGGLGTETFATPSYDVSYVMSDPTFQAANVQPSHYADPVDTRSGAATLDRTDFVLASGTSPLTLSRRYDSRQRHTDGPFGCGWTHNWDMQVVVHADPEARLGRSTPASCVPSVVACTVVNDLLLAETNARNVTIACLVAKWWTDQLVEGADSVRADGQTLSFERSPDGTFTPAPGVTASFVASNNASFVLQARLGNTSTYGTSGKVIRVQDPSGNSIKTYYHNSNNDYLVAVSNSFGRKLTFTWTSGRVSSVQDSAGRTVSYRYSPLGCLTSVTDTAGYDWNYAYDADNNLLTETDPGNVITLLNAYNSFGQVTNQVAANGQSTRFAFADGVSSWQVDALGGRTASAFDPDGRLFCRVTPDNYTNAFFYDSQGQMVSNLDALGRVSIRTYDASNNLVSITEVANTFNARTNLFGYDNQFHLVIVTNPLGRVTRMTYDTCHRLTSHTSPDGTTVTNVYDSRGLPISTLVHDATGRQLVSTTYAYNSDGLATNVTSTDAGSVFFRHDKTGNPTNVIDALGRTTRLFYDPRGLLTNTMDAAGNRTRRNYTSAGRLAATIDPLNRTNLLTWTASGQPAATRLANGGQITNEYDVADRLVAVKDVRNNRVQLGLDVMGRTTNRATAVWSEKAWYNPVGSVTTTVDVVGGQTDIGYDDLSRPYAVVDPMNRLWQTGSDPMNAVTNSVDARGRVTRYSLDTLGRRTRVTYPSGRVESFALDALGRMTAFTNSEGHVYRLAYDGQGRLIAATNAANEQVFRNYFDPCGNLTNKVDAASRRVLYQYDVLNRCTNTVYADNSAESFTFDAIGNLLTAKNTGTTNLFGYSSMNQLTSAVSRVAGVSFTNLYRYDLGGLATNVVYPGNKIVRYAFDADGRLTNVTDWAGHTWTFTRDAAGRMTALTYPNGVAGNWGYDAGNAVTNWSYTGSSGLPGRRITRDTMGLKTREDVTGFVPRPSVNRRAVNTFDAADRLISAQVTVGTNAFTETYVHDLCGAITNIMRGTGTNDIYTYDLAGRLVSALTTNNLQPTVYSLLTCSYDALGNRVKTTVNGATRLWAIDHSDPLKRPLMETDTNGAPIRYYIWGGGQLLAAIDADGTTRYAHSDEQGNLVALTDAGGAAVFTAAYGPYGESWGATGANVTPFAWLGNHGVFRAGDTSLYLTRHRAYDTTLKRWLSQDPLGLAGGVNLYGYGNGNPLVYIDPLGLCGESVAGGFFRGLGEYFTSGDYSANMAKGCETVLYSPYNAIVGTAGYLGRLTDDPLGTLEGTFNNPANAIQNVNAARFKNFLSDPVAIVSSIWGGGLMAMSLNPSTAAADSMAFGSVETSVLRVRHYGNIDGIQSDMAINPSSALRGGNTMLAGVHVEVAPFGDVPTASGQLGATPGTAYVEFNAPPNMVQTFIGSRNTAVIPTQTPLSLQNLNPTFVSAKPWWKIW